MNKQGIPSLKELFCGVVIDPMGRGANRHLKAAAQGTVVNSAKLFLELVTVPVPPDDDEGGDDDEFSDEDGEGVCAYCELPLDECECELDGDDDDDGVEDEDPCDKYPKGCAACREYSCPGGEGEDDDEDCEDEMEKLVVKVQRGTGPWRELTEDEIGKSPALCRFLAAINDYHGF
jgi:hypothetical protein